MPDLKNSIESLLFISHKPLDASEIAKITGGEKKAVEASLIDLAAEYGSADSGIILQSLEGKYQMSTAPESSDAVAKFIKSEITGELTRPSLETLTIIAYRGPVSKAELELIRGVNCSLILRNLLMRGLIEAKEDKSREITVYSITMEFLKYLGLGKVEDLPDFESLNRNNNLEKLLTSSIEENLEIKNELKNPEND